jgi:glycosyltransferase involved in cell wall biosynthesis
MKVKAKIAAVIPAYNEEKHVGKVVEEAVTFADTVIVVDDGSADSTFTEASLDGAVQVIRHKRNIGVGAALETGIRAALKLKPKVIVTLDADGQHLPEEIPALAEPILRGQAHITVGQRDFNVMSLPRKASNILTARILNRMFKVPLPDVQCGFRAIRGDIAPHLLGWDRGYPWACEMLIKAEALNLKMASASITTINPEKSHIKPLTETLRFLNMLLRESQTALGIL